MFNKKFDFKLLDFIKGLDLKFIIDDKQMHQINK